MPKHYTFPTLYNEVLQLKISELNKWEYLNPNKITSITITWNRNRNKTGSISITVITSKKILLLSLITLTMINHEIIW